MSQQQILRAIHVPVLEVSKAYCVKKVKQVRDIVSKYYVISYFTPAIKINAYYRPLRIISMPEWWEMRFREWASQMHL